MFLGDSFMVVINEAIAMELIERDPFIGFKLENVKVKKEFLTLAEVRLLSEYEFEKPHLTDIAKSYLFCAACGLRFSDAMALKRRNITIDEKAQHWLSIEQMKTKAVLTVPMFRVAVEIHDYLKDKYPEMDTVLKPVTNQFANRALKQIASLVGIQKKLKFHSSRHTFACSLIQQGADIYATSKLMGHSSLVSTQVYTRISSARILEVVKELDQK
jgi:integrase